MKTYRVRPEDVVRNWWLIDAEGKVLGRLASEVAKLLRASTRSIISRMLIAEILW